MGIAALNRLGLLFLYNSSNCYTQMNQLTKATRTALVPVSVKAGTVLSWQTVFALVKNLKNRLPQPWRDVIPVEDAEDVKACVVLIVCLFLVFALAGAYDLMLEGGTL